MIISGKATDVAFAGWGKEGDIFMVYLIDGKQEHVVTLDRSHLERLASQIHVALRESDPVGVEQEGE